MADIVKTRDLLSAEAKFADDDTRTVTLKNPADNLTAAQIKAVAGSALVGDKTGAAFVRWEKAERNRVTTTYYDITE